MLHSICQQIWKNQQWLETALEKVSFHSNPKESISHSTVPNSLQPNGLEPTRLLCPWNSPGKNTGVGCPVLLQGIFLTQGLNPGLLHCGQILYHLSHQGSPISKKSKAKESSNYCTIALISHTIERWCSKSWELGFNSTWTENFQMFKLDLEKAEGTRDQTANIRWILDKAREVQKNIYFCFIDYAKAFDCMDHNKVWKILKEMGIPNHLTCLLRNLYAGQSHS